MYAYEMSIAKSSYCLDAGSHLAQAEKYAGMGASRTATYHAKQAMALLARANDISAFIASMPDEEVAA